jgi:hypothetical protein
LRGSSPTHWQSPTPPLPLDAKLYQRLQDWRAAPIPEPALWVQFNLQTCPDDRVGKNANYDLLKVWFEFLFFLLTQIVWLKCRRSKSTVLVSSYILAPLLQLFHHAFPETTFQQHTSYN